MYFFVWYEIENGWLFFNFKKTAMMNEMMIFDELSDRKSHVKTMAFSLQNHCEFSSNQFQKLAGLGMIVIPKVIADEKKN